MCCDYALKMALTRLDGETLEELEELMSRPPVRAESTSRETVS